MNVLHLNLHTNKVVDLRDNSSNLGAQSLPAMRAVIATSENLASEIAPSRLSYKMLCQIALYQNLYAESRAH